MQIEIADYCLFCRSIHLLRVNPYFSEADLLWQWRCYCSVHDSFFYVDSDHYTLIVA